MKALIFKNIVVQLEDNTFPVADGLQWMDAPQNCKVGWILQEGVLQPEPVPEKTQQERINEYKNEMQAYIDKEARLKNYDDGFACASYANSTNATWKQEATDFIAWRDSCWQYAIDVQNDVTSGAIDAPSVSDFILNAPVLTW